MLKKEKGKSHVEQIIIIIRIIKFRDDNTMFPLSFNDLRRLIRFISIDEFVARVIYRWIELWRSFRYDEIFSPVPTRETMRSDIFARASIRATLERLRFLSLWSKVTSLVQQLLSIAKIPLLWGVSPSFVSRYLRDEREKKKRKKGKVEWNFLYHQWLNIFFLQSY